MITHTHTHTHIHTHKHTHTLSLSLSLTPTPTHPRPTVGPHIGANLIAQFNGTRAVVVFLRLFVKRRLVCVTKSLFFFLSFSYCFCFSRDTEETDKTTIPLARQPLFAVNRFFFLLFFFFGTAVERRKLSERLSHAEEK